MKSPVQLRRFAGVEVVPFLDAVAALRITVFRDWPYLYDGDAAYEREYLAAYAASGRSVFVLAFDGGRVIGAATGLPLVDDTAEFRAPFAAAGIDVSTIFYFGESVLLPEYRGLGIGHAFFDHREAHAEAFGCFQRTAFCAVDRDADDPRCPVDDRDNHAFWTKRGYRRADGMTMRLHWNEIDKGEIPHALTFWMRRLDGAPQGGGRVE